MLNEVNDGEQGSSAPESEPRSADSISDRKLILLAEELAVGKETVETDRLRVSKQTHTREALIDETLFHEHAEIETVPIPRRAISSRRAVPNKQAGSFATRQDKQCRTRGSSHN
jgi:stress response protein YsnF